MRFAALLSLIPALFLVDACGRSPAEGTGETDTDSSGSSSSGSATTDGPGGACIAGQSVACACKDGTEGAQVCNAAGSGYEPCVCTGAPTSGETSEPTTTTMSATTGEVTTGDVTTGEVTLSGGMTSTGDASTTGTSTGGGSSTGGSTGGGDEPYGPCPNGDECLPGDTCVDGTANVMMMMVPWSFCSPGTCMDNDDCDSAPNDACADAPGDGQALNYCVPQVCSAQDPCPMGMTCFPGFGGGGTAVCMWAS